MSLIETLYDKYYRLTGDAQAAAMLVTADVQLGRRPQLVSVQEAASQLGVSVETVRTLCKRRDLESVRVGRKFRIYQKSIEEYLTNKTKVRSRHF